jgi:hypothetical protein
MYMPPIDPNKITKTKAYKAVKKSLKKYASDIGEKGLVRATQHRIGSAMETVSERLGHISAFFKNVYGKLKREWKSLRSPMDKSRANWLAASISHVQDSIHKQIHGEKLTYADVQSWAGNKDLQRDVQATFRWRFELMGKSQDEIDEFERAIMQDNMNLTVINYLVEILCEDLPSFRVFIYGSDQEKNSRIAEIQAKINNCLSGVDKIPENHMDTDSVKRPAQGYYRISPNATMEEIERLSALSAKPQQNKRKLFIKMKKRTIKDLVEKRKYLNRSRKFLDKQKANKRAATAAEPGAGAGAGAGRGRAKTGVHPPPQAPAAPLVNPNSALGRSLQQYRSRGQHQQQQSMDEEGEIQSPIGRGRGKPRRTPPGSPPYSLDSPYMGP